MRARKKKSPRFSAKAFGGDGVNIPRASFNLGSITADTSPVPYIAGITDGDQSDYGRLRFREWQMKSPQERFAESALGDIIGASPLGDSAGEHGVDRWSERDDYWGSMARNVSAGGSLDRARLSNVAGVEGDSNVRIAALYDQARASGEIDPMTTYEDFYQQIKAAAEPGRR